MAFVMLLTLLCTNMGTVNLFADAKKIEVWDFGGVVQSGEMYNNNISLDFLNAQTGFPTGKWATAGNYDFNGVTLTVNANDRMFNAGANNYGSNAKATVDFGDGYVANGMYYANGTGGDNRRYAVVHNVSAGDKITVYAGTSNSTDTNTYCEYVGTDGNVQKDIQLLPAASGKLEYIANYSGDYKIWFDAGGGKPVINRIMLTPSVTVSGSVDVSGVTGLGEYTLKFINKTTDAETVATVVENNFSVALTPGYDYTAIMSGVVGFGPTNATKTVSVPETAVATGEMSGVSIVVEVKALYTATGSIAGFAADYAKLGDLAVTLTPPEDSLSEAVIPTVNADLTYSATLEPDVEYTVVLAGVNDYEVVAGGTFYSSANVTQNIEVATKAVYAASGKFVTLDGDFAGDAGTLTFTNVEDGYEYVANVTGDTYTVDLRDGAYSAAISSADYSTSSHVVVKGGATSKDLLVVSTDKTINPLPWQADIYVNPKDSSAYATVKEAVAAAKAMAPTSEEQRITIHIAPGTYREQIIVDTPYISFVNDSEKEDVILTWYYGIGYQYYSADATGYYNDENAFDKYAKNSASKWGVGTYIKGSATAFRAEGITFEASFNKYVTDEEIADGVVTGGADAKNFERKINSDVNSKASTERSTALAIEADNAEFVNCSMIGSQDTLYTGAAINVYIKNCDIEGNTDFMFGDGDIVFDTCELRWAGYSDQASGGHLTATKDTATYGYLYRNCTVTARKTAYADDSIKMVQTPGTFGRTWGAGARVAFLNTKLENNTMISAAGWGSMNGDPANANYKEYNTTTLNKSAVDTSGRVAGTVITDSSAINVKDYFGSDWTPVNFVDEDATVAIQGNVSISDNGDINLPKWGHTLTAVYDLGEANNNNDASVAEWYRVDAGGNETFITSTTATIGNTYKIAQEDAGYYIKVVVYPETASGVKGNSGSFTISALVDGTYEDPDQKGDVVIGDGINVFLAGDSTVKDYSAGAINNATTRVEGSWGEFIQEYFGKQVTVVNYANGGRSSKSFIDEGSLATIDSKMKAGDYLFVQFGHNDCAYATADRYVPVGEPDSNGVYPTTEGTFKYYLKQYVDTAKAKGAIPVLCTPVSRMYFNSDGTIRAHHDDDKSSNNAYVTAVIQLAQEEGVQLFDTFEMTKDLYEEAYKVDGAAGASTTATRLFAPGEKTHHSKLGGMVIAGKLAEMIQDSSLGLGNYIVTPSRVDAVDHEGKSEFTVSAAGVLTAYDKDANDNYSVVCSYWSKYCNDIFAVLKGEVTTDTTVTTETTSETTTETTSETASDESTETTTEGYITPAKTEIINGNLSIVAGISSVNFKEAGFILTSNGKTVKRSIDTVYTSIDGSGYTLSDVGGNYMLNFNITDLPQSGSGDIEIITYAITMDGREITQEKIVVSIGVVTPQSVIDTAVVSGAAVEVVDIIDKKGEDLYDEAI